ncbi:hypothetical protein AGMMS50212_06410 [Spirochaetia bacterium]|nr:hypothetical protein AGMMS50212_06340 [Spirochaetia bacterium]GHV83301.1 hypothetical protein AGMMS50212_06410 [Spirochaetia bacterium]
MKGSFRWFFLFSLNIFFIFFLSCESDADKRDAVPWSASKKIIVREEILDYQGKKEGRPLPDWLTTYLDGDSTLIENINEYSGSYVFIAEQSSPNYSVLKQWEENFRIEQDFTQLVFYRSYNRMTVDLQEMPDNIYGAFFELFMKSISDSAWQDAERETSFWIRVRSFNPNEGGNSQDIYKLMILCLINKYSMQKQMDAILDGIEINRKLYTRAQLSAVNRIKSNFFRSF